MHSSAFRRLDFKTQVFVPHECDHFRTRLTHTLEVAQVGRSLARALRLNEDLVEAVALAHDLGHPPFGHTGEAALDELMAQHGHFEHNRQSLRVVDYLEHPYPSFRGLNLTRVVRECLAKHTSRYDAPVCDDFDPALLGPLEGQLVDLADEIAYTSADLDDALSAGWISTEQLEDSPLWRRSWDQVAGEYPQAPAIARQIRAAKTILAILADDLVATTAVAMRDSPADDVDAVRRAGGRLVGHSGPVRAALSALEDLLMQKVYLHPANLAHGQGNRQVVRELFETFAAHPDRLPPRYRSRMEADGLQRVCCDYVAGMTDRFCLQEHARLAPANR